MSRAYAVLVLVLLTVILVPTLTAVHAQSNPVVDVNSRFELNKYGYAIASETVTFTNDQTTAVAVPDVQIGFGSLGPFIVSVNMTGAQLENTTSVGTYLVRGGQSLPAGGSSSFTIGILMNGIVTHPANGSLQVIILTQPYVSLTLAHLASVIQMPTSTQFAQAPTGFGTTTSSGNVTYTRSQTNVTALAALTPLATVKASSAANFYPLEVYYATRVITVGSQGNPVVTDTLSFQNLGNNALQILTISPLTSASGSVTVIPASVPPLLNPVKVSLTNDGITLSKYSSLLAVQPDANYTIAYQYPLSQQYYSTSGSAVTLNIPEQPPIPAFVHTYSISLSVSPGVSAVQGRPTGLVLKEESPLKTGTLTMAYSLSVGWALDSGVPAASVLFVVLLLGLFVSRATMTEEEETEEESATERASAMIKAFEEKTSLINQMLVDIPNTDPNERDKAYFDELRSRLDAYRSRALQRLNEVKQKSTTQKFFDLLNQLHTTEREVDRASKDALNLYEQYYTNRMRKEVFDRLSPSYRKRLEKALNQLSEELHVAQREAKLL